MERPLIMESILITTQKLYFDSYQKGERIIHLKMYFLINYQMR